MCCAALASAATIPISDWTAFALLQVEMGCDLEEVRAKLGLDWGSDVRHPPAHAASLWPAGKAAGKEGRQAA